MSISDNLKSVSQRITDAALRAGRDPSHISLIAVSKTRPADYVTEAMKCGQLDFGENRPQELAAKAEQIGGSVRWHQIGQLQKNKVRHIISHTALIHSVDSLSLAEEIEKRAAAIGKIQDILIQVNISGEESKSGVSPSGAVRLCRDIANLPHVHICGLMTISVRDYDYNQNKQLFSALASLASEIEAEKIENVSMKELSMGMTHDFEAAVEAGATMVRVGEAIFGERDYSLNNPTQNINQ